jgi:hypothetical protein
MYIRYYQLLNEGLDLYQEISYNPMIIFFIGLIVIVFTITFIGILTSVFF